jgi:hypothetical protein
MLQAGSVMGQSQAYDSDKLVISRSGTDATLILALEIRKWATKGGTELRVMGYDRKNSLTHIEELLASNSALTVKSCIYFLAPSVS